MPFIQCGDHSRVNNRKTGGGQGRPAFQSMKKGAKAKIAKDPVTQEMTDFRKR